MSYAITKINVDGDHWVRMAAQALVDDDGTEVTQERCNLYLWGVISAQFTKLQDLLVARVKDRKDVKDYVTELLEAGILTVYLGPEDRKDNHRYKIATIKPYKGHREEITPEVKRAMRFLRSRLIERYRAIVVQGMETDDRVSIESKKNPTGTLTISNDKDDRQTPGWWWWWDSTLKYPRKPYYVDGSQYGTLLLERTTGNKVELFATGEYQIAYQMLCGDIADNIPGVANGYGPVKCYELLKEANSTRSPLDIARQEYNLIHKQNSQTRWGEVYQLVKMLDNG